MQFRYLLKATQFQGFLQRLYHVCYFQIFTIYV